MIPVRCMSCGGVLGNLEDRFRDAVLEYRSEAEALDSLGLFSDCCRWTMTTYVDVVSETLAYEQANEHKPPNDTSADWIVVHKPKPRTCEEPPGTVSLVERQPARARNWILAR